MSSSVLPFVSSLNINTTATISSITSVNIMKILQNPMLLTARPIASPIFDKIVNVHGITSIVVMFEMSNLKI